VTAQLMSRFQAEARKEGMKTTTLARHLRHIKASLRWAERQGMLAKAPGIEMPKLAKGQSMAKHRPITGEEFERMIAAIPKVRPKDAPAWERLLRGLWLTGLRLGEALALDWEDGLFVLDSTGRHPRFVIEAEGQKSRRSEVVPTTPDFADWILEATPKDQREGKVFPITDPTSRKSLALHTVGPKIALIGLKARVIVGQEEKTVIEDGKRIKDVLPMFATAHDLRRAFCTRWARKVMPAVLQKLARHSSIQTTMSFYVNLNADEIGEELWSQHGVDKAPEKSQEGNNLGNTAQETTQGAGVENHT
jgi:integrase